LGECAEDMLSAIFHIEHTQFHRFFCCMLLRSSLFLSRKSILIKAFAILILFPGYRSAIHPD